MKTVVSDCCGAEPRGFNGPGGTIDHDSTDIGICPECGDHCDFVDEEEDEEFETLLPSA